MRYEPIKDFLGKYISGSPLLRRVFYFLIDTLLLRTWHVHRAIRKASGILPSDSNVLDAGSGMGQYSWKMSSINRHWKIKGIDIIESEIAACNSFVSKAGRSNRVSFESGDLTKLADKEVYNLILTVDVMEHILEDELVFTNFRTALKDGGILIVSTPSDQGGSGAHDHDDESFIDEHVRNGYGIGEITAKLTAAGFRNIDVKYTYGRPGTVSWLLSMKVPVKLLNISYAFFLLLPFWYIAVMPFSLLLNLADLYTVHSRGTGLLVTATR